MGEELVAELSSVIGYFLFSPHGCELSTGLILRGERVGLVMTITLPIDRHEQKIHRSRFKHHTINHELAVISYAATPTSNSVGRELVLALKKLEHGLSPKKTFVVRLEVLRIGGTRNTSRRANVALKTLACIQKAIAHTSNVLAVKFEG